MMEVYPEKLITLPQQLFESLIRSLEIGLEQ